MIIKPDMIAEKFMNLRKIDTSAKTQSTGFLSIDEHMRLARRYLMIVTGYPSCGKSEFLDGINVNMSLLHDWKHLYYSPENEPIEEHMQKIAEKYIGKPIKEFTTIELERALYFLQKYFTWVNPEEPELDLLIELATKEVVDNGLDSFVIDPWNAVMHKRGKELIHEYLSEALSKIIRFSRKHNVLMAVVAHPTKPTKDRDGNIPPLTLYDISDGAMWRNKADYGVVCERPNMLDNTIKIKIQKIKYKWMGKVGEVVLDYNYKSGRFKCKEALDFSLPTDIEPPF
jgi:twinkle protein